MMENRSKNKKILVVDDDPSILEMVCEGLMDNGFDVISAMSPQEALEKIKKKEVTFAILDVDLGSPLMNGIGLGKKIKQASEDIIVIIMTGYHNIKLAVDAMRSHAFDYMIKPFRIDQVISLMERSEREMKVHTENRRLKEQIEKLEQTIQTLRGKVENLAAENSGLTSQKMKTQNVQSERAVRSYQKQK